MLDNFNLEIFRFKIRLRDLDVDDLTIEKCVQEFNSKFALILDQVLNEGLDEAKGLGVAKQSGEFLAELRSDARTGQITTDSGKTDFSVQPFSMRPGLLKNAKTAKDGTRYKVVPIGGESGKPNPFALSSADAAKALSREQQASLQARLASAKLSNPSKKQQFTTITDKQDPSTFMHPGFERDFTSDMLRINQDIKYKLHQEAKELMDQIESRAYKGDF